MRKKFLTNVFILLAVNLLIKPFWILGVDRAVQNTVGNHQYGVYANLFAFSFLFVMLLDFGINNYSSTSVAKDHTIIGNQFSLLVTLKIFFSAAYFIVTIIAGFFYGFRGNMLLLLGVMSFNQILAYFILYFRSNISGLQFFRTDALLSVVDRCLMIILCSLIIWANYAKVNIETFVYAQTLGYFLSAVICFLVLKPHLSNIRLNFDQSILWKILKEAYPYAVLALIMTLYTRLDNILIKKLLPDGDAENGIYASANRLLEASNMLAAMVATMLLSLFAKIMTQKQELQKMVKTVMSVMIAPATMLAVFCNAYRSEIMHLLYRESTGYSIEVFGVVIISFIPMCTMYIFGTLLTANGDLKILKRITLFALFINLILNLIFIPVYGAKGSAIIAVGTHSIVAVLSFFYARKVLGLKISLFNILQYVMFAIVFAVVIYFIQQTATGLITALLIGGAAGISLMFISGILNYRSLLQLVSSGLKR